MIGGCATSREARANFHSVVCKPKAPSKTTGEHTSLTVAWGYTSSTSRHSHGEQMRCSSSGLRLQSRANGHLLFRLAHVLLLTCKVPLMWVWFSRAAVQHPWSGLRIRSPPAVQSTAPLPPPSVLRPMGHLRLECLCWRRLNSGLQTSNGTCGGGCGGDTLVHLWFGKTGALWGPWQSSFRAASTPLN